MPSLVKQLNLTTSKASVLIALEPDCEHDGITVPMGGNNLYFVVMNSRKPAESLGITLAHEMVHVAQMSRGILRSGSRGEQYWSGRRYPKNTPYLDRPWEIQAFSKQELLLRRAIAETEA